MECSICRQKVQPKSAPKSDDDDFAPMPFKWESVERALPIPMSAVAFIAKSSVAELCALAENA